MLEQLNTLPDKLKQWRQERFIKRLRSFRGPGETEAQMVGNFLETVPDNASGKSKKQLGWLLDYCLKTASVSILSHEEGIKPDNLKIPVGHKGEIAHYLLEQKSLQVHILFPDGSEGIMPLSIGTILLPQVQP